MVDLKRLNHLVALADECHFARAADRVHLSQPAFSRSIQLLESQVGMKLFDRDAGEVKPTPAGLFLIDRARRLLFDARSLQRDVQLYRETKLGDTAFGAGPFPAATIMPEVISELRRQYPSVGLRLETSNWEMLLSLLMAEDIEFFVSDVRDLPRDPRLAITSIGRQLGQLLVRAGHPLAGTPCTFAQAWQYGLATTRWPIAIKGLVAGLLGVAPEQMPAQALQCDDMGLLRTLAASTDTVIAAAESSCRGELEAGTLVALQVLDLPEVYSEMGIVTLADRTCSPMANRAIGCVQQVAVQMNRPSASA